MMVVALLMMMMMSYAVLFPNKKKKKKSWSQKYNVKYVKHKPSNMIWLDVIWEWAEILSLETSLSLNNTIQSFERFFLQIYAL